MHARILTLLLTSRNLINYLEYSFNNKHENSAVFIVHHNKLFPFIWWIAVACIYNCDQRKPLSPQNDFSPLWIWKFGAGMVRHIIRILHSCYWINNNSIWKYQTGLCEYVWWRHTRNQLYTDLQFYRPTEVA